MVNERIHTERDRSLGDLFGDLTREITTLVRQEIQLARTEMTQKLSHVGKDVGMIAVGGAVAYLGLMAIMATIVIALAAAGLAWWASTLLVGVVIVLVGGGMAWAGLNALKQTDLAPRETMATLEENKEWAQQQTT
jgi:uncharacterized membrane protein YqjE